MNNFSKNALLSHIQSSQLKKIVATVFQHHTVFAGVFCRIYHFPNLFQGHSGRNFTGYVFPMLHSINHHRCMVSPVGSYVYQVYVISFT